jgi:hypothetical protein
VLGVPKDNTRIFFKEYEKEKKVERILGAKKCNY